MHLPHVLDENRGAVDEFDRDVVEVLDGGRHRVGADGELGVADLGRAGRQRQVLGIDRIDNVDRREPLGLKLQRIDIDHDLAVLAAGRGRKRDAVDGRELLPQAVDAVVVELLLIERVRGQPDLQHRNARGVVLDHDRRLNSRRHQRRG